MKNAKVKGKDGKPQKKLRVAKFNFCIGMQFPFRHLSNGMSLYDYRPTMNNIISFNKNSNNDFAACSYNNVNQNFASPTSPQQSSPISANSGPQVSPRSASFLPMQYYDSKTLSDRNSETQVHPTIKHHYYNNQNQNDFSNTTKKIYENSNSSQNETGLASFQQSGPNNISKNESKNEADDYNPSTSNINLKFPLSYISEPSSFQDIVPSTFDIVRRGPLPSITLKTNGKIELSDI